MLYVVGKLLQHKIVCREAIDSIFSPLTKPDNGGGGGGSAEIEDRLFTDQDKTPCQRTVRQMILANGASRGRGIGYLQGGNTTNAGQDSD